MPEATLKAEFEYYLAHQAELVEKFRGQFVVIKGQRVLGAYPTELDAVKAASRVEVPGTFLVQKCEPGDAEYTQSFHSRVSFA